MKSAFHVFTESPRRTILTNNGFHKRQTYRPSIRFIEVPKKTIRKTANSKKSGKFYFLVSIMT